MRINLPPAYRCQTLVERLASHHVAGLGFGTGFDHDSIPEALLEEARAQGFPVFEVPYALPFIAITERAFTSLVNEQYEVLQRSIAIHKRLERLVLEERGLDELVRALAAAIGGVVVVLSARGEPMDPQHDPMSQPRKVGVGTLLACLPSSDPTVSSSSSSGQGLVR